MVLSEHVNAAPMLLEALGAPAPAATEGRDDLTMRVLDALAAAPADPDALARRLGMSGPAFATVIARLLIRGQVAAAADGRLARR